MEIELKERTSETVLTYFRATRDAEIQRSETYAVGAEQNRREE